MPHILAGCLTLHPVSVPNAAIHSHAATAAQLHHDDHHEILERSDGFFTGPNAELSLLPHIANSSILVFHIRHHQAFSNSSKQCALYGA